MFQGRLDTMIGKPSGYLETLPNKLRNRIAYLGELQDQHDELEEKLHEEQMALQRKYDDLWSTHITALSLHLYTDTSCTCGSTPAEHHLRAADHGHISLCVQVCVCKQQLFSPGSLSHWQSHCHVGQERQAGLHRHEAADLVVFISQHLHAVQLCTLCTILTVYDTCKGVCARPAV